MAEVNFYRAFEDRHRGSRGLIKSRLEIYLPFVAPLKLLYNAPKALDLGCGRGEWLELVQHNGFQAKGVDLDEGMLLACRELGLDTTQADALEYIKSLEPDSLSVVSAFHVVEHISFDVLRELVGEAHRVLIPGGLLILETPNPENLVVGTSNFYLDPTHQRPLPSQLLSFVVEFAGFGRVKTLYLQESPDLVTSQRISLTNVLNGVSPDYAVVAQKKALVEQLTQYDVLFGKECGLTLEALSSRFEERLNHRFSDIEAKVQHAENSAQQAENKAQQAENKAQQAENKAQQAENKAQQAENKMQQAEAALTAIHNSTFWRITAPFRIVVKGVRKVFRLSNAIYSAPKGKAKLVMMHARLYINRRPKLKRTILAIFRAFPIMKQRLKLSSSTREQRPKELVALPLQARQVFAEIRSARKQQNKKGV